MNSKMIVRFATLSLLSATALAASVPNVFTAGTTIRSGQMNANFTALVNAVTALEDRVAALEGSGLTLASLAGTYQFHNFEAKLDETTGGGGHRGADVNIGVGTGTITLSANGTFTYSLSFKRTETEVDSFPVGPHTHPLFPAGSGTTDNASTDADNVVIGTERDNDAPSGGGTWDITGGEIALTFVSEGLVARFHPASSRLLLGTTEQQSTSGDIDDLYAIVMLVRQ